MWCMSETIKTVIGICQDWPNRFSPEIIHAPSRENFMRIYKMIACDRESALMFYQIFSTNAFKKYVENLYENTRD